MSVQTIPLYLSTSTANARPLSPQIGKQAAASASSSPLSSPKDPGITSDGSPAPAPPPKRPNAPRDANETSSPAVVVSAPAPAPPTVPKQVTRVAPPSPLTPSPNQPSSPMSSSNWSMLPMSSSDSLAASTASAPSLPPQHPSSGRPGLLQPRPAVSRSGSAGSAVANAALTSSVRLGALASKVASNARETGFAFGKKSRERFAALQNRSVTAPPTFSSPGKSNGLVFGKPLSEIVRPMKPGAPRDLTHATERERQRAEAAPHLPAIARRCFEYLDVWGTTEEGIYRIPGSASQIAHLKGIFDAGKEEDLRLRQPGELDPHAVASLFKLWLRDLPESLLTPELERPFDSLMLAHTGQPATSRNSLMNSPPMPSTSRSNPSAPMPALISDLCALFAKLPPENWYLLRELAEHLAHLDRHCDQTRMTLDALRLILSPTLRISPAMLQIMVERRRSLFVSRHAAARPDFDSLRQAASQSVDANQADRAGLGILQSVGSPPGSNQSTPRTPIADQFCSLRTSLSLSSPSTRAVPEPSGTSVERPIDDAPRESAGQAPIGDKHQGAKRIQPPPPLQPHVPSETSRLESPLTSPALTTPSLTSSSIETAESAAGLGLDPILVSLRDLPKLQQEGDLGAPPTQPLHDGSLPTIAPVVSTEGDGLASWFDGELTVEQRKLFFEGAS